MAAVLSLCDGLEEIRLSGCGIKDDGAIELFEELKQADTVNIVDLSDNELTDRVFKGLTKLL